MDIVSGVRRAGAAMLRPLDREWEDGVRRVRA